VAALSSFSQSVEHESITGSTEGFCCSMFLPEVKTQASDVPQAGLRIELPVPLKTQPADSSSATK
jgi:hypothetical protein